MNKGPNESKDHEVTKIIKLQDLEPGKEYVAAEDTQLYTGPDNRRTSTLVIPKGTSFGVPAEVFSEIQIYFRNNVKVCLAVGALNTDEIKVYKK